MMFNNVTSKNTEPMKRCNRNGIHTMIAVAATILLAACGRTEASEKQQTLNNSSPVVNTIVPNTSSDVSFGDGFCHAKAGRKHVAIDSHKLKYGIGSFFPGGTVMGVGIARKDGKEYLLVATRANATSGCTIRCYYDKNGDDVPDASTGRTLVSTGSQPCYITSMDVNDDFSKLFMLDRRCQDVLYATDTDGNGWPDTMATSPCARSADFPNLKRAGFIRASGTKDVDLECLPVSDHARNRLRRVDPLCRIELRGGVATDVTPPRRPYWSVSINWPVIEGDTEVFVSGGCAEEGTEVEIWTLDGGGNLLTRLGTAPMPTDGSKVVVPLRAALTRGTRLRAKYKQRRRPIGEMIVKADVPHVMRFKPSRIKRTTSETTVQVFGRAFTPSTQIQMRKSGKNKPWTNVPSAYLSDGEMSFTLPPMADEAWVFIRAIKPGQDVVADKPTSQWLHFR